MSASTSRLKHLLQRLRLRAAVLRQQIEPGTFRPIRAENVRLVGQMKESAFARPPWLVERGGKFIQLSELLYVVTRLADGSRSIDEIAADASAGLTSEVPAGVIRQLIDSRLVPAGIISSQASSGAPQSSPKQPSTATTRSPFALNMRMAVISPALIDAAT
jgi:hypothetical protein